MKRLWISVISLFVSLIAFAQTTTNTLPRPKLVVGLMVDQMRWDYLYRFYDRYGSGGFKRLLGEGFTCDNTFIPYAQTVTAAGHTSVYTGTVPAIHGIMGNDWYERSLGKSLYCTQDDSVTVIGGAPTANPQSPRNLLTTTMCDELRLATNFQSKVIAVALKDRGGILPGGHTANAAYWYDTKSGNWVTSTYYMNELPNWVTQFNHRKVVDSFYRLNWNTLYPINTYTQSDKDNVPYEGKYAHETAPVFPHDLASQVGKNYGLISATPYGNVMTLAFARNAVENEGLGKDAITDFLAVSLSSPDYIGHQFGPNSIEVEDNYLRLDKELAAFFTYLDAKVGKGQYLFFLTADHAVAHNPAFLSSHKIPVKSLSYQVPRINQAVAEKFKVPNVIAVSHNYQLYLSDYRIDSAGANKTEIKKFIVKLLNEVPEILLSYDTENISDVNLPTELKEMFLKGYNTKRGGDIQIILKPGFFYGGATGTAHGSMYPYDSHIPLVWMGWGIKHGRSNSTYYMTDIAATVAALLRIQMPSGCIGKPITEVMK